MSCSLFVSVWLMRMQKNVSIAKLMKYREILTLSANMINFCSEWVIPELESWTDSVNLYTVNSVPGQYLVCNTSWFHDHEFFLSLLFNSFEYTKDTPYLALTGVTWVSFVKIFDKNWSRYNGTALYVFLAIQDVLYTTKVLFVLSANWATDSASC